MSDTEVWVRNPSTCIRECLEVGVQNIVFDRGFLVSRNIDPARFMAMHYSTHPWRLLQIGVQGTTEITSDTPHKPRAVYPTWEYGDDWSILEEICENNPGDDDEVCSDESIPLGLRPVKGQEHRVVITNTPVANTAIGKTFYRVLRELQDEHPEVILHVHGLYSFRVMFGLGFRSVDIEPRLLAQRGRVVLPVGKEVPYEVAQAEFDHWLSLMGFTKKDVEVPRNRCMFNIKSAQWAALHFRENVKFQHKGFTHVNPDNPIGRQPENYSIMVKRKPVKETDKFLCDTCSLQNACKYFRSGAVCVVPGAEPTPLARYFNTRDSDSIINGLGTLLESQVRRMERGMEGEEKDQKLDPEVTKIAKLVFDGGVKLAKLVNPGLDRPNQPAFNFNTLNINSASPQAVMSAIVDALEARGVPRESITPEMVEAILSHNAEQQPQAIEATAMQHKGQ